MEQRKTSKIGNGLAKTTSWIRLTLLKRRNVKMLAGVSYEKIDDAGLQQAGVAVSLIGGADVAAELDAKRAIDQGTRVASTL